MPLLVPGGVANLVADEDGRRRQDEPISVLRHVRGAEVNRVVRPIRIMCGLKGAWDIMGGCHEVALACLNGHLLNVITSPTLPLGVRFCKICGAELVTQCQECGASITEFRAPAPGISVPFGRLLPAFCHSCGQPYPWTQSKLAAAQDLIEELAAIEPHEREILKKSLDDLVRETPHMPVAETRFKRLVAKAGAGAADTLKALLVDVLSEAAKRAIWS